VTAVLRTPWLSRGPRLPEFEEALAERVGATHAVAVSSGTAGLHLCVRASEIRAGDEVITSPFSFVASANAVLYEGATPIFVDVDPVSLDLDPGRIEAAVTARTRAILVVHVFGRPAPMTDILAIARGRGLTVLEDACEALGAELEGRQVGTFGACGVFAFYPNKQITTGEGGVIVTDRDEWAEAMRSLRNQGRAPGDTWLQHTHLGYNYRMDEMSAALGVAQMERLDELLDRRQRVAGWYEERLSEQAGVSTLSISPATTRMSWFVYVVRFAAGIDRQAVARRLAALGIPSRPYFTPIHLQPYFIERFGYQPGDFPIAEDLGRRSLALPFSSVMTEEQVETVCDAVREAMAG
jgi:dTDP-4-amino-4,6-dideoxygalactose transaminase